jgi:hypothetical protein
VSGGVGVRVGTLARGECAGLAPDGAEVWRFDPATLVLRRTAVP